MYIMSKEKDYQFYSQSCHLGKINPFAILHIHSFNKYLYFVL